MTTMETPLTEIATFLDPDDASRIFDQPSNVQVMILTGMRAFMVSVEESGKAYDPITLAWALKGYIDSFLDHFKPQGETDDS